jgi:hypothetical protein
MSATGCLFQNSTDKVLREIYNKLIAPYEAALDISDYTGLQRLCSDRKYAHCVSDYMLLLPLFMPPCSITFVPRAFYPGTMAIGMAKMNPYRGIMDFM